MSLLIEKVEGQSPARARVVAARTQAEVGVQSGGGAFLFSCRKVASIAINTFRESIRQPVFGVIMAVAFALIVLSPMYTLFTLMESPKLIKDMGLATILLAGLLLSAFSAGNVISAEIENKTALTVLSKPVGRIEFILGKYLGVALSLLLAGYVLSVVLILTVAAGAFEADLQVVHRWVVFGMIGAGVLTVGTALFANYYMDRPFASTAVLLAVPFFTACLLVFLVWTPPPEMVTYYVKVDPQVALGCFLVMCALFVLGAVAVAASVRLNMVLNVTLCAGVLLLGLLSDYLFGRFAWRYEVADVVYAESNFGRPEQEEFFKAAATALDRISPAMTSAVLASARQRGIELARPQGMTEFVLANLGEFETHDTSVPKLAGNAATMVRHGVRVGALEAKYLTLLGEGKKAYYVAAGNRLLGVIGLLDKSSLPARVAHALVPNLQVFWIAQALAAERPVPVSYAFSAGGYAALYSLAMLCLAVLLIERREIS